MLELAFSHIEITELLEKCTGVIWITLDLLNNCYAHVELYLHLAPKVLGIIPLLQKVILQELIQDRRRQIGRRGQRNSQRDI